jgi:hypothetical protein
VHSVISVRHLSGENYEVTVKAAHESIHRIRLSEADHLRLAGNDTSAEKLITESFHFLLEREPNSSILSKFDLPLISRYFPEYEDEIRKRLE